MVIRLLTDPERLLLVTHGGWLILLLLKQVSGRALYMVTRSVEVRCPSAAGHWLPSSSPGLWTYVCVTCWWQETPFSRRLGGAWRFEYAEIRIWGRICMHTLLRGLRFSQRLFGLYRRSELADCTVGTSSAVAWSYTYVERNDYDMCVCVCCKFWGNSSSNLLF